MYDVSETYLVYSLNIVPKNKMRKSVSICFFNLSIIKAYDDGLQADDRVNELEKAR